MKDQPLSGRGKTCISGRIQARDTEERRGESPRGCCKPGEQAAMWPTPTGAERISVDPAQPMIPGHTLRS